jgi:two-component system response regulator AlgR
MNPLRVFIADDEAPARERLRELLADIAAELSTEVAGEAQNGLETVERLPASGAHVLLLDIQMPGMGGLEVARTSPASHSAGGGVRHRARPACSRGLQLNALDYLMKPVRTERLAAALKRLLPGREQP